MNTKTGEIVKFNTEEERTGFIASKRAEGPAGKWWRECAVEPTTKTGQLKGHHPCPCGSGKRFRDCCRGVPAA
jgi:uncharacterized protein YchJ